MIELILFLLTILGGIMVGIQAPINGTLGKSIGGYEAAFFSFVIGALALSFIVIFFGKGNILSVFEAPKWQLVGGMLGAIYVTVMVLAVPKIGTASALYASIAGQVVMGTIIDHYGLFGSQKILIDWQRLLAIVLMSAALYLVYKSSSLS